MYLVAAMQIKNDDVLNLVEQKYKNFIVGFSIGKIFQKWIHFCILNSQSKIKDESITVVFQNPSFYFLKQIHDYDRIWKSKLQKLTKIFPTRLISTVSSMKRYRIIHVSSLRRIWYQMKWKVSILDLRSADVTTEQ